MGNLLYQITPDSIMLMNCYVIKTKNDKIIVIDGGGVASENCGYLYKELQKISGKEVPEIDAWFFSHMHDDHMNGVIELIAPDGTTQEVAFTIEELIAGVIIVSLACVSFNGITIFSLNLSNIIIMLMIMFLGWKHGIIVGAVTGISVGFG